MNRTTQPAALLVLPLPFPTASHRLSFATAWSEAHAEWTAPSGASDHALTIRGQMRGKWVMPMELSLHRVSPRVALNSGTPRWAVAFLMASILSGCVAGPVSRLSSREPVVAAPDDFEIIRRKEAYQVEGKLRSVRLVNRYGDLRVRMSDTHELGVTSVIQRMGRPGREPIFEVRKGLDRIEFEVRYAGDTPDTPVDFTRGRVDLVVFVQRGAAIEAETAAGTLEVRRAQGVVSAMSTTGKLSASSAASLDLRSASGDIYARLMSLEPGGNTTLASASGNIELGVPVDGSYTLELEGKRGVTLTEDWKPGEIAQPDAGAARFRFARGSGKNRIVATTRGSIQLSPVILLPPRTLPPASE